MKPFDLPVTHNPIQTRNDVISLLTDILEPCQDHLTMNDGGLFIGNSSAHYSSRVALFEGWSRLLWGIVPMEAGGHAWKGTKRFVRALAECTDPASPGYWGDIVDSDQRMVELASISLGLMTAPDIFWDPLDGEAKNRLNRWMTSINGKKMSDNNWKFFRIFVNVAMEKVGMPYDEEQLEIDLQFVESLYTDDGWYRDNVPFDGYNPWGFHFYSMVYYREMKDKDPQRCQRFRDRAFAFARQYQYCFTKEGNCVPYGRSLTYRFASVCFFSACAFAGLEVLPWGVMKGIVLRSLRWWIAQPIFTTDGLLSIGYSYPSLLVADNYNAPGSPYWGLKVFLMLSLSEDHPFWKNKESPLPALERTKLLKMPRSIAQRTESGDVVLLNAGQYPTFDMNHAAEKYAKFAYSATYGFSCSLSNYGFPNLGCDNMLFFSEGDGYWRQRREVDDVVLSDSMVRSTWHPYADVSVTTWIIPFEDWHITIHRIETPRPLETKEGGFAILHYKGQEMEPKVELLPDGVQLPWGVSIIKDLMDQRTFEVVTPKPNLNLTQSTTLVPVLCGVVHPGTSYLAAIIGAGKATLLKDRMPQLAFLPQEKRLILRGNAFSLI